MRFPVVLHTDDGTRYGVTVPDPHLEGLTEDGHGVPTPQPIGHHQKTPDYAGGVWALVEVDVTRFEGKAEKVNITLPQRLLARIDEYARSHGASRSGFLAEAARQAMR